ncbi:MAG TPA: Ig-like domain-containing protein [Vicinamibacterales bacterium]|nr:Ig-like domain-containing protein [Vicinamibacterales bacterium]
MAGSSSFIAPSSVTINASGADIWGASDQFHFAYIPVSGNVDVRIRVDSVPATSTWAKVGVMVRASLQANAAHGFALVSYSKGLAFQRRPTTGALSVHTAGELAYAPRWVRLVRLDNLVTAYSSTDGITWRTIGSDTIQLGATAYVGIAATSRNTFAAGAFRVSQVTMTVPSALPGGQASADIGQPALKGSAAFANGTYTLTAAGVDIWGTSDQFHYVYQQASGDIDVKVRVASISYADPWSKAGVMIRASLDANAAHGLALMSAGKGSAFQRRNVTGGLTVHTTGATAAPPGWVRLKRSGSLVTAYRSADGVNWVAIGSDSIVLPDQVYVGIAATSHNATAATTAKLDTFSVVESAPVNNPPVVSIAASGSVFTAPASITLTATASDPENQLARVEFYSGTTLLGSDSAAPYTVTVSGVAAGVYGFRAVAYDAQGASGTSSTISVTVGVPATPIKLAFTTTSTEMAKATDYVLEFFAAGADPATATAIVRQSLGKPALDATGTATVDITTLFNSLAAGNYLATVSAVWSGGVSRSAAISFTK